MATLRFGAGTDLKVMTPISSALAGLPNGAGTMMVLMHKTATTGQDFVGLNNSTLTEWYHALHAGADVTAPSDDDGLAAIQPSATVAFGTTDWWWLAVDWPAGGASLERFHWRNHTTGGTWSNNNSAGNNGGNRTLTGTGWLRIGGFADEANGVMDCALVAVWAGTRLADANYGTWTKTSDLYNHSAGKPTTLIEMNATTLVDIGLNPSTYSSGNSSGTTLTGANPPTWTFDGQGAAVAVGNRLKRWAY